MTAETPSYEVLQNEEISKPFQIGDIILDGGEDSVVVWEDGEPTAWALRFYKWRKYFNIPPPEQHPEEDEPANTDVTLTNGDSQDQRSPKKRSAEESGLEMNACKPWEMECKS